jgi:hypothetical protein
VASPDATREATVEVAPTDVVEPEPVAESTPEEVIEVEPATVVKTLPAPEPQPIVDSAAEEVSEANVEAETVVETTPSDTDDPEIGATVSFEESAVEPKDTPDSSNWFDSANESSLPRRCLRLGRGECASDHDAGSINLFAPEPNAESEPDAEVEPDSKLVDEAEAVEAVFSESDGIAELEDAAEDEEQADAVLPLDAEPNDTTPVDTAPAGAAAADTVALEDDEVEDLNTPEDADMPVDNNDNEASEQSASHAVRSGRGDDPHDIYDRSFDLFEFEFVIEFDADSTGRPQSGKQ